METVAIWQALHHKKYGKGVVLDILSNGGILVKLDQVGLGFMLAPDSEWERVRERGTPLAEFAQRRWVLFSRLDLLDCFDPEIEEFYCD